MGVSSSWAVANKPAKARVVDVTYGCNKLDVWVPNQKQNQPHLRILEKWRELQECVSSGQVVTSHVSVRNGNIQKQLIRRDQVHYIRTYSAKVFPSKNSTQSRKAPDVICFFPPLSYWMSWEVAHIKSTDRLRQVISKF